MGFPGSFLDELIAKTPKGFEVWPANMPILDAWLMIASQWRTEAMPDGRVHWFGLDYASVCAGFRLASYEPTAEIWAGLQLMERAAGNALNGGTERSDDP